LLHDIEHSCELWQCHANKGMEAYNMIMELTLHE